MPLLTSIQDILEAYDYVVVGGGLSGCVLASRLSEDEEVNVLLLEAGVYHDDTDPLIATPAYTFGQFMKPDYDWAFKTTPQTALGDRVVTWNRGKGLGGSTNMNLLHWAHPSSEDIDAWGKLGNPGWSFEMLLPYLKKSHRFFPESESNLIAKVAPVDPSSFGTEGNVSVSYAKTSPAGQIVLLETFEQLSIPANKNAYAGDIFGISPGIYVVNPNTGKRVTAFTAYLQPYLSRLNLHVLTEATVAKLVLVDTLNNLVSVKGVEVIYQGKTYVIPVNKEAILAAGAINSPQILELSGIGDQGVLSAVGIDVKVDLPGVGNNLQEHPIGGPLTLELTKEESMKHGKTDEEYARYFHPSFIANVPIQFFPNANISPIIEEQVKLERDGSLREQYTILGNRLSNPRIPECEIVVWTRVLDPTFISPSNAQYISLGFFLYGPRSRGTTHITSKDPLQRPALAANHLKEDIDLKLMVETLKFLRTVASTSPFSSVVEKEIFPGPDVQTDAQIEEIIRKTMITAWHGSGSLAMMPREKGGVVGPDLKVWGTTNIRVVDISIHPLIISAHTQATVYAVAEYAADLVRGRV